MSKKSKKRLKLSRQSVRRLQDQELKGAQGGTGPLAGTADCQTLLCGDPVPFNNNNTGRCGG